LNLPWPPHHTSTFTWTSFGIVDVLLFGESGSNGDEE
jgi:hypothetical protein